MNKKKILIILKPVAIIVISIMFYSCSPKVEEVGYYVYSTRNNNSLHISVNTYRGLLRGRDSFLNFKRDEYWLSFETRSKTYTEKDAKVNIFSWFRTDEFGIRLKQATIEIQDDPPKGIIVSIDINDDRVPKLINGEYRLSLDYKDRPVLYHDVKDTETSYTLKR